MDGGRVICGDLLGFTEDIGFVCLDFTPAMQSDLRETTDRSRVVTGTSAMTESGATADVDRGVAVQSKNVHVKAAKHKPPSKRNTPCGYPGCNFNGVNIKRHTQSVHPGKPIHIRGSGFEPSGPFSHWIAPSRPGLEVSERACINTSGPFCCLRILFAVLYPIEISYA